MTTPKINTIRRSGSRFYVEPQTGEKVPGVTSVLNMLAKPFLRYWAAKVVAEEAIRDLDALVALGRSNPEGAIDYLKRAPDRVTRNAADTGTDAHDYFERLALGANVGDLGEIPENVLPFVEHYVDFLDAVQPEFVMLEETVWSDEHRYAGSFDAFATIEGERVWLDNKTTRSGVHDEVGLQLAAYRYAEHVLRPDGSRTPVPSADGGAVVHVRPEGWQLVPVKCGEREFEVFLHLRQIFDFDTFEKKSIVGSPVASNLPDKTGPKRTVARPRA